MELSTDSMAVSWWAFNLTRLYGDNIITNNTSECCSSGRCLSFALCPFLHNLFIVNGKIYPEHCSIWFNSWFSCFFCHVVRPAFDPNQFRIHLLLFDSIAGSGCWLTEHGRHLKWVFVSVGRLRSCVCECECVCANSDFVIFMLMTGSIQCYRNLEPPFIVFFSSHKCHWKSHWKLNLFAKMWKIEWKRNERAAQIQTSKQVLHFVADNLRIVERRWWRP